MPTNTPAPAKGTQPEGAHTEADASRKVREMFTQIAPRYDLLNHLLSLQLDRLWREPRCPVMLAAHPGGPRRFHSA